MGVARRDVAEQIGDADHGARKIVVVKADGPQHGAVRRPAGSLGGESADAIAGRGHGGDSSSRRRELACVSSLYRPGPASAIGGDRRREAGLNGEGNDRKLVMVPPIPADSLHRDRAVSGPPAEAGAKNLGLFRGPSDGPTGRGVATIATKWPPAVPNPGFVGSPSRRFVASLFAVSSVEETAEHATVQVCLTAVRALEEARRIPL